VIVPGACGGGGEFYLMDVLERFLAQNFKCVTINHRGISPFPITKGKLYHSGYTDDLEDVMAFLAQNVKNSKFFLLGFSMGGNIVTKFIGEQGENARDQYKVFFMRITNNLIFFKIYGGCSVCGPLDLARLTENLEGPSAYFKIYSKFFCSNLKKVYSRNEKQILEKLSNGNQSPYFFQSQLFYKISLIF
jgi:predicted alpha/beta-fold hydrolase